MSLLGQSVGEYTIRLDTFKLTLSILVEAIDPDVADSLPFALCRLTHKNSKRSFQSKRALCAQMKSVTAPHICQVVREWTST